MKVQILCTLGPSSLRPDVIAGLDERGVDLFRINLSHTPLEAVAPAIEQIRRHSATPICLDTEGAQVRCGPMAPDVTLAPGRTVRLTAAGPLGTGEQLGLQPQAALESLRPGAELGIDFNGARLRVTEVTPDGATAVVVEGGQVGSNKAVTVDPAPLLPALSDKDRQAIAIGTSMGVRHVALSFARRAEDVGLVRSLAGPGTTVIAKLEQRGPPATSAPAVWMPRGCRHFAKAGNRVAKLGRPIRSLVAEDQTAEGVRDQTELSP
ncbi:MAG TPA: pyruvate kinase [Actinomycetes bacterium]|nr:pyruvate kinase [Actinomycetes bacterium]